MSLNMSLSPDHPFYHIYQTIDDLFSQTARTKDSRKIDFIDNGFLVLLKAFENKSSAFL